MSLGVPNIEGGRSSEGGWFNAFGKIFKGNVVSGFRVRQDNPLGMSVRIGGEVGVPDGLLLKDNALNTFPVFNPDRQPIVAAVDPPTPSNLRIDAVVIYIDFENTAPTHGVYDNQNMVKAKVVAGTPSQTPSPPNSSQIVVAIGGNTTYAVIAEIDVPASSGTNHIIDSMIRNMPIPAALKDDFVTEDSLAPAAVTTEAIKDASVTPDKLDPEIVTGVNLNSQTTTSDGFVALANPSASVEVGEKGKVRITLMAQITNTSVNNGGVITVAATGENTIAAGTAGIPVLGGLVHNNNVSGTFTLQGLQPGETTFTMYVRRYGGSGTMGISNRQIQVEVL